ncbi:carboxypeptidase-like regulatory domain-containing protein [Catalinimonas sp. 4WD22]|uniref:carboxypeptidase-like regulatory domain-containing protein n=1 Tax=Catalinimonas locisalis TaxID=3133978 RepID=UPI003100AB80
MKKKYFGYFVLLLVFLPILSYGQEEVIIEGRVVDADSLQALPLVHVSIKNANLGGVTDTDGRFRIRVNLTDSIVFSSVGYKPYLIVPADTTPQSLSKLIVRMEPQITVLDEVKFKEYIDITKYIPRQYDSTVDLRRSQGTPMLENWEPKEKNAVGVGGGENGARLEGAVTAFANLFNSEFQQKKKLEEILKIEEEEKRNQSIKEAMTEKYEAMVSVAADLNQYDIQRFTDLYMPHPFVMMEMSDYEVMEDIVKHLRTFRPQPDPLERLLENGNFEGQNSRKQPVNPPKP